MAAIVRITAEFDGAQGAANVWHYRCPNVDLETEAQEAVDQLETFYLAVEDSLGAGNWRIGETVQTVDQSPNTFVGVTSAIVPVTGTGRELLSACVLLRWGSGIVGGSHRGRTYMGPLDAGCIDTDGRSIVGSQLTIFTNAAAALLTATAAGAQLGTWSRKNESFTVATSVGVRPFAATQRGRLI